MPAVFCNRPSHSCASCYHFRTDTEEDREVCFLGAKNELLEYEDLDPMEIKLYGFDKLKSLNPKFKRTDNGKLVVI